MKNSIELKKKIAKVVKRRRQEEGLTQEALAKSIMRCTAFVCKLENLKSSLPAECVPALAKKLRFKSTIEFWQQVEPKEDKLIDDGWDQ